MHNDTKKLLKNTFFFREFSDHDLDLVVPLFKRKHARKDECLIDKGVSGTSLYLIELGSVSLSYDTNNGDEASATILGTGGIFGANGFYEHNEKSMFRARCLENTEVLELAHNDLREFFELHPNLETSFHNSFWKYYSNLSRILLKKLETLSL